MITDFRVKIRRFFKKHKKEVIIFFLVLWLIVFIINMALKNQKPKILPPSTNYVPHKAMYQENVEVPEKYQEPIESLIDKYFNYCNNGQYEEAYSLITEESRRNVYPTLEQFKGYVDYVFEGKKKIYNIQNCSIVDNKYIYNIRILDDILATGTTEGYSYYEEKLILIEDNGQMKLSIGEYIGDRDPNIEIEADDMIVKIENVSADYETETYTITVTNKTDKYIVIADNTQKDEIGLDLGDNIRHPQNMVFASFYVKPNSSATKKIKFNNAYDNGLKAQKLIFGSIRILNEYDPMVGTTQENLDSAVKLYGMKINLNKK